MAKALVHIDQRIAIGPELRIYRYFSRLSLSADPILGTGKSVEDGGWDRGCHPTTLNTQHVRRCQHNNTNVFIYFIFNKKKLNITVLDSVAAVSRRARVSRMSGSATLP